MKKSILSLLTIAVLFTSTAFANGPKDVVNEKVAIAFKQKFGQAKEISWIKTNDVIKATFKMNEQYMNAYYTPTGELMGIYRNIVTTQLPINLQAELSNNYSQYWVTEVFEYATEEGTNYYITVENSDKKIQMKSVEISSWVVYKKVKKN